MTRISDVGRVMVPVADQDEAIAFYTERLGFEVVVRPAPPFAMLARGELRLLLSAPSGPGGGAAMAGGRRPEPGGWNRFQIEVEDLDAAVEALCAELRRLSPLALAMGKRVLDHAYEAPLSTGLEIEGLAYGLLRSSDDFQEGVHAFVEKREPRFRGR